MNRVMKFIKKFSLPLLTVALLVIALLTVLLLEARSEVGRYEHSEEKFNNLLYPINGGVKGQACGLLSKSLATELLDDGVVEGRNSRYQGAGSQGVNTADDSNFYWSDFCSFVSSSNNNRYIELVINTYQNDQKAEQAMDKLLPVVNEAKTLDPPEGYAQYLYDSGVHYLRSDREILMIAASNGNPAEDQEFSAHVTRVILDRR